MSKILIIEDDAAIAELEKDYLELSDFEVAIESDGSSGAAHAVDEDFDLILLDICFRGWMVLKFVSISGRKRTRLSLWFRQKKMILTR